MLDTSGTPSRHFTCNLLGMRSLYFGPAEGCGERVLLESPEEMRKAAGNFMACVTASAGAKEISPLLHIRYILPAEYGIGDLNTLWFSNIYSQLDGYAKLAITDSSHHKKYYETMIELISRYENYFKERTCDAATMGDIEFNMLNICRFAASAYGYLVEIYHAGTATEKRKTYSFCLKSIEYGEAFICRLKDIKKKSALNLVNFESFLPQIQHKLMHSYFFAYQYLRIANEKFPGAGGHYLEYKEKAQELRKILKKNTEFKTSSRDLMSAFDAFDAARAPVSGRPLTKKYKEVRNAEAGVLFAHKVESYNEKSQDWSEQLHNKCKYVNTQIDLDISNASLEKSKKTPGITRFASLQEIKELERMVDDQAGAGEHAASAESVQHHDADSLKAVYGKYRGILGDERFHIACVRYPLVFLCAGDVDGALVHVRAFDAVLLELEEKPRIQYRKISALVKSIHGEYDELLALEAESAQVFAKLQALKEAQEQEARETLLNDVVGAQAAGATAQAAREAKKQEAKAQQLANVHRRDGVNFSRGVATSCSEAAAGGGSAFYCGEAAAGGGGGSKDGKMARHVIAMTRRGALEHVAVTVQDDSLLGGLASGSASGSTSADLAETPTTRLQSLYNFTGVPLVVNDAIESGHWTFTRDELQTYYAAMGCTLKSGKGSHEKVCLPKAPGHPALNVFEKDGVVITALLDPGHDLGGALTLPRWDGTVPHYLRKQIRMACEKLATFAEKARTNESTNATTEPSASDV